MINSEEVSEPRENVSQREPRYSVVIPAYNAANTLNDCLRALVHQSVSRDIYEVLVVDDGSSDKTVEIASCFPVRVLRQAHLGPASARNLGAQAAKGDILLFTDADCAPEHTWIEEIVRSLESDPRVAGAKGCYKTRQSQLIARIAQIEFEEKYAELRRHRYIDFIDTSSAAVRKEVFWEVGGFDTSFPAASNEDTALSFSLASRGQPLVFAEKAVVYHCHPESLRQYLLRKWRHGYWRVRVYRLYPSKMAGDSYTPKSTQVQLLATSLAVVTAFLPGLRAYAVAFSLLFLLATFPFVRRALPAGREVAVAIPLVLLLRSISLMAGLIIGSLKLPFDKQLSRTLSATDTSVSGQMGNAEDT